MTAIGMHIVAERDFDCLRLLLVDQRMTSAAALAAGLEASAQGLKATAVSGGRQAVECLRAQSYDVLLVEFGSLGEIAEEPHDAVSRLIKLAGSALVIALSNDASISATVEMMRAGAHDCIAREIEPAALAQRIACLARRHGKTRMLGQIGSLVDAAMPDTEVIARRGPVAPSGVLPMWRQEQRIIEDAIASFAGNVALAAAALELSPSTIYRKRQAWAELDGKRGAA
jgi:DNA-binding NtrC family response regulator